MPLNPGAKSIKKTAKVSSQNSSNPKSGQGKKPSTSKQSAVRNTPAKKNQKGNENKDASNKESKVVSKPKKWSKEDFAARTIQTNYRGFKARKLLKTLKQKHNEYEETMEKLEKEAYILLTKMQQEEEEKERAKEEAERKRKREDLRRRKQMLEAAFEGEVQQMSSILDKVRQIDDENGIGTDEMGVVLREKHLLAMVDCEDANKNTPLSEAASGGNVESIEFLISNGADPNSIGNFQRTPLYRAAFAGHFEACQILLKNGADPRIFANDGQTPAQIASVQKVEELLKEWDINEVEKILEQRELKKQQRAEAEKKQQATKTLELQELVERAEKIYQNAQTEYSKRKMELNKRINEHDSAVAKGFAKPELTLQSIHDAEAQLELANINMEKSRDELAKTKLQLREQQNCETGEELPGICINIRELDDVLMRDIGNKIKDSLKWPLILDPSSQTATFLRYRDTNYLNALNPMQMDSETIRLGLLGALRYGKSLVIDMQEVDMFDSISMRFNEVLPNLMNLILDRSLLENDKYLSLIRPGDAEEYNRNNFCESRILNFKFILLTKNTHLSTNVLDLFYVIRIHISL